MVAIDDSLPHLQFESDFKSRFGQTKTQVKPEKEVANESKIVIENQIGNAWIANQCFFSLGNCIFRGKVWLIFFPFGLFLSKFKSSLEATDIFNLAELFIDAINLPPGILRRLLSF